ncbi:rhamnulokinase [Brachybacterium sp. MASK1Z-5]|uniref:Rhamnulokinase n=1 Tax=Brachybacterium halotolerans TaxID=2795215 RepID=A0ABS1B8P7_9MICO|nr:FGGY-family carbohydrate kinase [Brachybacterium halotolerans]MBK0331023.1 rhamnulokinase [Brachybacterium halotolerans]
MSPGPASDGARPQADGADGARLRAEGADGARPQADDRPLALAAIDLGATSGRVMVGLLHPSPSATTGGGGRGDGGHGDDDNDDPTRRLDLHAAHRFENRLERRDGHLSWDIDALWEQVRQGLAAAERLAQDLGADGIASIGVDSWAVDYALVGPDGERIGEVIAYRDDRTDGAAESVAHRVDVGRQFALTGIAQQPFNTLYQLAVDDRLANAPDGTQALLVPDLLSLLLTGERRTELTNASTTGMLAAGENAWSPELLGAAGVTKEQFAPLVRPGERVGTVRSDLARELGIGEVPVIAVGSHDTASAVLAVPAAEDDPVAFISSGTWSLIGLELESPVLTEAARGAGFTNERGVDSTYRFLKNVAGMWLVSESIAQWEESGARIDLDDLLAAAAAVPGDRFRINPTDPCFLAPGRMAGRVADAARVIGGDEERPRTPAHLVRCILESLAETYRDELHAACRLARRPLPERLHVVGGGSRNRLLNQLTADALGIEVVAGPMEATALGNLTLQARALGAIPHRSGSIRELVRASVELEVFAPGGTSASSAR